ncbi:DUF4054 domain-containing protein [Anaerosolibacter sp.]|uniref:DUF4054 domain-containing protein n=1 Tax=Anaerosolibacter sp. TaxID=1872527 RepID=UPI0039F07953
MAILQTFRKVAPEFAGIGDAEVQGWIDLSGPFVSQKRFADLYEIALAYYTAHMIKLSQPEHISENANVAGLIVSEKEGDVSRHYADTSSKLGAVGIELSKTLYGRQFMTLSKRRSLPGVTRMGKDIEGYYG